MTTRILRGDCRAMMRTLEPESVHMAVTSPPYWGLRSYGVEPTLWGGDHACDHEFADEVVERQIRKGMGLEELGKRYRGGGKKHGKIATFDIHRGSCVKCGCWRGDLGLEPTPDLFIEHMVEVFDEVWRVLRPDGTIWVNIGDSYTSGGGAGAGEQGRSGDRFGRAHTQKYLGVNKGGRRDPVNSGKHQERIEPCAARDGNGGIPFAPAEQPNRSPQVGLKAKDLVGVPWMLAFALRARGWYLRQDIVWQKPNPMPESIEDRCTKAHEYVFLLSKSESYFFDAEAIKESASENSHARRAKDGSGPQGVTPKSHEHGMGVKANTSFHAACNDLVSRRNKRSVWTVATQPFKEAHFATFPPALIEPTILAGTSERGCCMRCAAPWERITAPSARYAQVLGRSYHDHEDDDGKGMMQHRGENRQNNIRAAGVTTKETVTLGWYPTCGCDALSKLPALPPSPRLERDDGDYERDLTKAERKLLDEMRAAWRVECSKVNAERAKLCEASAPIKTNPAIVLDPFGGSGTTGMVADRLGRDSILCELNPEYARMAAKRIEGDAGLFAKVAAE